MSWLTLLSFSRRNWQAIAAALLLAALYAWHAGQVRAARAEGYASARAEIEAAQQLAREANRLASHAAEGKETERIVYRDRVITKTSTEIRHATAPLASCPLPARAIGLLNDAARAAREDRPAPGPADGPLPDAG